MNLDNLQLTTDNKIAGSFRLMMALMFLMSGSMFTSNTPGSPARGQPRKDLSIASLMLGIWGLLSYGLFFFGASLLLLDEISWSRSIVGMVLGIIALVKADRNQAAYAAGKGVVIVGILTNSVSLLIGIIGLIATGNVFWYR